MKILGDFGIDPVILGAQIVNFLIILYLLKRFAYKPIFDVLAKRKQAIEQGIKQSQEAQHALEQALNEEKKLLKKAKSQADEMLDDAKKQAEHLAKDIQEKTQSEVSRMIADAKTTIAQDRMTMEKHLMSSTATLAITILEKSLQGFFSPDEQKRVIERAKKVLSNKK